MDKKLQKYLSFLSLYIFSISVLQHIAEQSVKWNNCDAELELIGGRSAGDANAAGACTGEGSSAGWGKMRMHCDAF